MSNYIKLCYKSFHANLYCSALWNSITRSRTSGNYSQEYPVHPELCRQSLLARGSRYVCEAVVNVAQTEINFHYPNSVQSISSADGGGGGEEEEEHLKPPSSSPLKPVKPSRRIL